MVYLTELLIGAAAAALYRGWSMLRRLSETFSEEELMELHDLAVRRRAHYLYVMERLREVVVVEPQRTTARTVARIMKRLARWEGEAQREVLAFRKALGRTPMSCSAGRPAV